MRNSLLNRLCSFSNSTNSIGSTKRLPKQLSSVNLSDSATTINQKDSVVQIKDKISKSKIKGISLLRNPSYYKVSKFKVIRLINYQID